MQTAHSFSELSVPACYGNTSDLQQQEASVSCFSGILSAYSAFPSKTNASWVLDTGATHHICCALNLFHFYIPTTSIVTLPNNSDVPATRVGTVHLSPEFILENVLYVPQFHFNLIYVSSLTKSMYYSVIFSHDSCHI